MRLAVVGCGDIGSTLAFFARLNPRIALVACADVDLGRARRSAGHRSKCYADYEKMLDEERPEALYAAVPTDQHAEVVAAAAQRGIHVLCEKPIATSAAAALEAIRAAESAGVRFAVNLQYRYYRTCNRLVRLSRTGGLGRILYVRCNVPWHRERSYFEDSPWHRSIDRSGGGTLLTQASHILDIALLACGALGMGAGSGADTEGKAGPQTGNPLYWRVFGLTRNLRFRTIEIEDFAAVTLELGDGPVVQVTSSMAAAVERPASIEVYGERATAVCTVGDLHSRLRVRHAKAERAGCAAENAPQALLGSSGACGSEERIPRIGAPGIHPIARSLEGFRRWVEEGRPHLSPARSAVASVAVIEAAYRSSRSGRPEIVADWRSAAPV